MKALRYTAWIAAAFLLVAHAPHCTASALHELSGAEDGISDPATQEDTLYSAGMKALNDNQWAQAESIFQELGSRGLSHAAAAYYWQAYAESKLGKPDQALATCKKLRRAYGTSHWVGECEALRIELSRGNGQPVSPAGEQDADMKLLALSAELGKDEQAALAEIEKMLAGSDSNSVKERALFVAAMSRSAAARDLLERVAHANGDPALRIRAESLLAMQQGNATAENSITVNVLATDGTGQPLAGLQASDFMLQDNGKPQPITEFRAVSPTAQPEAVHVMIVLDMINEDFATASRAREQIDEFLAQNGGQLSYPTVILAMTPGGVHALNQWTRDGKTLAANFDKLSTTLRAANHEGFSAASFRMEGSLGQLSQIAALGARTPGKKLLLVISPGWPMLPVAGDLATLRERRWTFNSIVQLSNGLREGKIALYSLDPHVLGSANPFYYQIYLKGVAWMDKASYGNLALQVLAEHSGGRALTSGHDILGELNRAVNEAGPYYELTFRASETTPPNEYHALKVLVTRPKATALTVAGYYANPQTQAGNALPPSEVIAP
jgi:VWFA-related protein